MSAHAIDVRKKWGWQFRRGVPSAILLPIVGLLLLLGHLVGPLQRYVFAFEIENRREVVVLSDAEASIARDALHTPLEESAADCWLELSGGRLARNKEGKVEVIDLDGHGAPRHRPSWASAGEELATVVSPFCWRETKDERLVVGREGSLVQLKSLETGAWARGFHAFGALFLVFAFAGVIVAVVVRRPSGLEVAGAATLAAFVEFLAMAKSMRWHLEAFGGVLTIHDVFGNDTAALMGFAPIVYLSFLVVAAAGFASLVTTLRDEIKDVRRCSDCLGAVSVDLPRSGECPHCGAVQPARIQWLVVSAAVLGVGILLGMLLHFGATFGMFAACTWDKPSEVCREAWRNGAGDGLLDWVGRGRRGAWEGDPGRLIVFRPAIYAVYALVPVVALPLALGRLLRDGYRTTVATIPALWLTSLAITFAFVSNGEPYFFLLLIRWHLVGAFFFGLFGLLGANVGLRLRGATEAGILADLGEEDAAPLPTAAAIPAQHGAIMVRPNAAFRGPQPGAGAGDGGDIPDDLAAALRPSFVARHRWKILIGFLVVAAGGGLGAFFKLRPSKEDRFLDSAFGKALGEPLTRYAIGMKRADAKDLASAVASDAVASQIGADARDDLRKSLELAATFESAEGDGEDTPGRKELFRSLDALDTKLSERGVPAFVGAYAEGRTVWLLSYAARSREEVRMGGEVLFVARGYRIDNMNLQSPVVFRPADSTWVTIALDALERQFLAEELNAMVRSSFTKPGEERDGSAPHARLASAAAKLAGEELAAASKLTAADAAEVDRLVRERNHYVEELRTKGYGVGSDRVFLQQSTVQSLQRARKDPLVDQVLKLDDRVRNHRQPVVTVLDLLGDLERDTFVVQLLEQRRLEKTEVAKLEEIEVDSPAIRAVLSAQLTMLSKLAEQKCPRLALWRGLETIFGRKASRAMQRAGTVAFSALFKELAIAGSTDRPVWRLEDDELSPAFTALVERNPTDVAAGAARVYPTIFGEPPPAPQRTPMK